LQASQAHKAQGQESAEMTSNLFLINHDEIERLLHEATAALREKCDRIIFQYSEVPDELETDADLGRARDILGRIREVKKEAHQEALKDQTPFKAAVKTVKEFYDDIEKPLADALQDILNRFLYAKREGLLSAGDDPGTTIGVNIEGESIATSTPLTHIMFVRSIECIDRATVDLEKLRNFLSEACLRKACERYHRKAGNKQDVIAGVTYREVARSCWHPA
jgi:hypothetical protein